MAESERELERLDNEHNQTKKQGRKNWMVGQGRNDVIPIVNGR